MEKLTIAIVLLLGLTSCSNDSDCYAERQAIIKKYDNIIEREEKSIGYALSSELLNRLRLDKQDALNRLNCN